MSANEGRNGARLSDPASQAVSSSNQAPGLAANSNYRLPSVHPNNDQGGGPSARMRDPPPPLGVKLTCYRLLNVTTGIFFVSLTAVLAYKNLTGAATTVGLLSGLSTLGLYWVGLYERRPGRNWFFHDDLVPIFVRGVTWAPSFLCDALVCHPFISIFLVGACFPMARYLPDWGTVIVSIGLTFPVVVILMGLVVGAASKRK
ncbi:hypothetical protein EDB83DRAFT_1981202 [Lactarius deliciosus]|nr:hypothetical protein EDB83DRAFT_1981202 [Lactarius deliciosus]